MRLYAFLLFALFAIAARAATIPENVAASEKKISVVPENTDKAPENISSEQELIDQANTVNDVDNKLRSKPEDIPVEVIVENVALKATKQDEKDDIVRPVVDLRDPGPPQRQEHETQNPEFYSAEQQLVQVYKQNINDAQNTLKQGLKSVSENVQSALQNNEQINLIQQSIQALRETFIAQINKFNSTIQGYLHADSSNAVSPGEEQTKANIQVAEVGLTALRDDFNKGVQTLTESLQSFASVRAENENNQPSSGAAPAPANPAPAGPLVTLITQLQNRVQTEFTNMQNVVTQGFNNLFNRTNQATPAAPPAGVQADTPAATATPAPPNWFNFQNIVKPFQDFVVQFQNIITPSTQKPAEASQPAAPAASASAEDAKPTDDKNQATQQVSQASPVSADGPIRQILQNNPISQGIANAVQRLQNINNPNSPRETEKEKPAEEPAKVDEKPKGHPPGVRDNNVDGSGVESEPTKEVQSETQPEPQEIKKEEEVKDQKTEEVVEKTE